jgi:hypothetical protein
MFYRTVFGPSVAHNAVMYARSDEGVARALRRLTGARLPDQPGEHQRLRAQQELFIATQQAFLMHLRDTYSQELIKLKPLEEEAKEHHADPHPKQKMRVEAWKELNETGDRFSRDTWLGRSRKRRRPFVTYKMKPHEHAKVDKKERGIGDLGVQASLLGFRLAEALKQAQTNNIIEWNGGHMHFVKSPDPVEMELAFKNLANPPGRYYFVFFSDDSVLSYHHQGSVKYHNLDISSCDASHTPALFQALKSLFPENIQSDVQLVIDQCAAAIRVRSRVSRAEVVLQPRGPKLYSGSTLTTAINNLANMLIALAISELPEITPEGIAPAAARAGYIVSGCEPVVFEQVQFLKHSPVRFGERFVPVINFGVFLRASGTCKGDLPGRGDLEKRARHFQQALVQGIFPRLHTPIIDSLRDNITPTAVFTKAVREQVYKTRIEHTERWDLKDEDLFARYDLDAGELDQLKVFAKTRFQQETSFTAIAKVLKLDYGLSTREVPRFACPRMQTTRARRL